MILTASDARASPKTDQTTISYSVATRKKLSWLTVVSHLVRYCTHCTSHIEGRNDSPRSATGEVLATGCDMKDKEVEFEDADSISYFGNESRRPYQRLELAHVMHPYTIGERIAVVKRLAGEIQPKYVTC